MIIALCQLLSVLSSSSSSRRTCSVASLRGPSWLSRRREVAIASCLRIVSGNIFWPSPPIVPATRLRGPPWLSRWAVRRHRGESLCWSWRRAPHILHLPYHAAARRLLVFRVHEQLFPLSWQLACASLCRVSVRCHSVVYSCPPLQGRMANSCAPLVAEMPAQSNGVALGCALWLTR
jgi:hypothetical protein